MYPCRWLPPSSDLTCSCRLQASTASVHFFSSLSAAVQYDGCVCGSPVPAQLRISKRGVTPAHCTMYAKHPVFFFACTQHCFDSPYFYVHGTSGFPLIRLMAICVMLAAPSPLPIAAYVYIIHARTLPTARLFSSTRTWPPYSPCPLTVTATCSYCSDGVWKENPTARLSVTDHNLPHSLVLCWARELPSNP